MYLKSITIILPSVLMSAFTAWAQCPACSNPSLQSGAKLEASMDTLFKGNLRVTINGIAGLALKGGHPNNKGLDPNGNVIPVIGHDHKVDLNMFRAQLAIEYTIASDWTIWARAPYDVKQQQALLDIPNAATQEEVAAIEANRNIHHRSETYTGLSDAKVLVARRFHRIGIKHSTLDVALGSTIPTGATQEDPLKAGAEGREHLHIQFGTGSCDPVVELHYNALIGNKLLLSMFSVNKQPMYTNSRNFKGGYEGVQGIGIGYGLTKWLTSRLSFASFIQNQSAWDGVKDPNSGLIAWNIAAYFPIRLGNNLQVIPGYRHPIKQRTLVPGGDTFKYGPTFLLNVSYGIAPNRDQTVFDLEHGKGKGLAMGSIKTSAHCGMCKTTIETAVWKVKGVKTAVLDLETKELRVSYKPSKTTLQNIRLAINAVGFDADGMLADPEAGGK